MKLSIVTPLYRSADYIDEFCRRICDVARRVTNDFELIMVIDGSPDDSLESALQLLDDFPWLKIINLSRNYGEHRAAMTGCAHACGEMVYYTHCDLEEAPEELTRFVEAYERTGADMVYGVKTDRGGGFTKSVLGGIFYRIFNCLSDRKIPYNMAGSRLMSRRYVDALNQYRERDVFLAGVLADVGFRQLPIEVDKTESGASTYSALARLRLALGATVAFSRRPIEYLLYLGLGMLTLTVLSGLIRLVWALASGQPIGNFSLLIFSVWLVGSLIICGMGVVGIYVAQSNLDVKGRPYAIVSDIFDCETRPSNSSAE